MNENILIMNNGIWQQCVNNVYLYGLEGAAEQHVVGRDQRTHRVVMGTDGVHLLQGLDVPHLHTHNRHNIVSKRVQLYILLKNGRRYLQ